MDTVSGRDEAIYWLWLQRKLGIPSRVIPSVMRLDGGARRVHESTPDQLWKMGLFSIKTINSLNDRDLEMDRQTLQRCDELGISVITPADNGYPRRLLSLFDPPAALYCKGDLAQLANRPCVALVGTRSATNYGRRTAKELAMRLARAGVTVVSGGAKGIDTAAHTGALEHHSARTICVLGCGIDCRYNMANEGLRDEIARRGALVSEYPPGTDASPYRFPIRNRIISGLSLGTVVIEAGMGSGSLITAGLASEQNREVFVVPSGAGMPNSKGTQSLLNDGAKAVYSPLDILKEYFPMYPGYITLDGTERPLMFGNEPQAEEMQIPEKKKTRPAAKKKSSASTEMKPAEKQQTSPKEPPAELSEEGRQMYLCLSEEPKLTDDLAAAAGMTVAQAATLLTELELLGAAQGHPGGRFSLA